MTKRSRRFLMLILRPGRLGGGSSPSLTTRAQQAVKRLGYGMRESRRVTIHDSTVRTLSNGRTSMRGTCASCGGRVVALAAPPEPTAS